MKSSRESKKKAGTTIISKPASGARLDDLWKVMSWFRGKALNLTKFISHPDLPERELKRIHS